MDVSPTPSYALLNAQKELEHRRRLAGVQPQQSKQLTEVDNSWLDKLKEQITAPLPVEEVEFAEPESTIVVHPSVMLALLEHNLEAAGRVYFLLKHLDSSNCGWIETSEARERLTNQASKTHVFSWRRLRQILAEGEGVTWQRKNGRIWLYSVARIAFNLDCHHLEGQPTMLPVQALLGGIQDVRAHFYASFHNGRQSTPISRERITAVTTVPERTQRSYDQVAEIKRQVNYAIGERYTKANLEKRAWQHGQAVFCFFDNDGQQGEPHGKYVAWQLPNSYVGVATTRSKRSKKRINQRLADLWTNGAVGNDKPEIDHVFWPDGAAAAKAYSRQQQSDAYWPRSQTRNSQTQLWAAIA